jgi:uncharacterized protein
MEYAATFRTSPLRLRERVGYDADAVHAVLDEAYDCALAFVVDGEPRVLPTLHVRIGGTLYVHGSTGSRPLLAADSSADSSADGAGGGSRGIPVCVSVTVLDGLVLARSQFHHSANYRSVVAHGLARPVTDPDVKRRVLAALVDKVGAGRSAHTRPPTARELASTGVLALPLAEVSVKARTGGVADEPDDYALPYWAGVVPLRRTVLPPRPDVGVTAAPPAYLPGWHTPVVLRGRRVMLEPLTLSHVDGLYAAIADDEVYRWQPRVRPADRAAMAASVAEALDDPARVPFAVRDGDRVVGTTSYHHPDPRQRSVEIGSTVLARHVWGTGVNTEAKLLLLTRAFDGLGAVRVEWHTDVRNLRSQRAIERLGARREGVRRAHRRLPDGTWRDSALYALTRPEWPAARDRLTAMVSDRAAADGAADRAEGGAAGGTADRAAGRPAGGAVELATPAV